MAAKSKKGGRRKGAGRKPLGELKQRNRVTVLLTDQELAELKRAAGEESHGTYVRRLLLRHLARRK